METKELTFKQKAKEGTIGMIIGLVLIFISSMIIVTVCNNAEPVIDDNYNYTELICIDKK